MPRVESPDFQVFPWSDNFALGIPLIDEQHRELVRLLNRVAQLYIEGATPADVEAVLQGLVAYAGRHFEDEERIWTAALAGEPSLTAHQRGHADFTAELAMIQLDSEDFGGVIERLLSYLTRWLAFHILDSDKRMALTLEGLREGLSVPEAQRRADEALSGAVGLLVQTVLGMYSRLVGQALELMHERHARLVAERALAEAEDRLRSLVSSAPDRVPAWAAWLEALFAAIPDAVLVANEATGQIEAVNPQAGRLFQCASEQLVGRSFLELHPPDAHTEARRDFHRLRDEGERWSVLDTEIIRADGTRIPVEVSSSRTLEVNGQQRLVGVFRDISERKAASEALRASEARAREVLERVPVGLIAVRVDTGQVVLANAHMCALLGVDRAAVGALDVARLHPPEVSAALYAKAARGDLGPAIEVPVCRLDGSQFMADLHQVPIVLDGQPCVLGSIFDLTERHAIEAALEAERARQAHAQVFDVLTGLLNRDAFIERLGVALAACAPPAYVAVAYLDVDDFTAVNLASGREQGDALLVEIGARLQAAAPGVVARIGGDEFGVLLGPGPQEKLATQVAGLVAAAAVAEGPGISASAGFAVALPGGSADAEQLLRQASQAMFEAKLLGPGRIQRFDQAAAEGQRWRAQHVAAFRRALGASELVLHYQPKVHLASGELLGVEALVRWQHPDEGLLFPGRFLPGLAGDAVLVELGDWVINAALARLAAWRAEGFETRVSVNVESLQLADPHFADRLAVQLAAWPTVAPGQLELEILETSALEETGRVAQVLGQVQALGVTCALDDFGSGYASLTFLKRLPVDAVKIDQSFVREMLDDSEQSVIIDGILGLARGLGREVIAEGVETEAHGRRLLALGCQHGQGFAIARAMPAAALRPWLARWRPPVSWRETRAVGAEGVPLLIARWAHEAWLEALRRGQPAGDAGGEDLTVQRALGQSVETCHLGRWLQRAWLRAHPELAEVVDRVAAPHAAVHRAADRWAAARRAGDQAAAEHHWRGVEDHSAALLAMLDARLVQFVPIPTPSGA